MGPNWHYSPICIQIFKDVDAKDIYGYSGIYIVDKNSDGDNHFLVSIGDGSIFSDPTIQLTCLLSTPALVNQHKVEWYSVELLRKISLFSPRQSVEENVSTDKLYSSIRQLLKTGFKFIPVQKNGDTVEDVLQNTSVLLFEMKKRGQTKEFYRKSKSSLKPIRFKMTVPEPHKIIIRSVPFNLTNPAMFMDFNSTSLISSQINDGTKVSGYLSDLKYLENMNGGVVVSHSCPDDSIGLVAGSLRKSNGDGELTIIFAWERILELISPSFTQDSTRIITPLCTLSELLLVPSSSLTDSENPLATTVIGLTIADDRDNHLFWGSGLLYNKDTILTNSHVVNTKARNIIRIMLDKHNNIKLNFQGLKAQATMKYDLDLTSSYDQIIVPFEDIDLAFIKLSVQNTQLLDDITKKLGIIPIEPVSSFDRNEPVETKGYGLFFNKIMNFSGPKNQQLLPLTSQGDVSSIWYFPLYTDSTEAEPVLLITSSSCWNGSSGGGLFTTRTGRFVGLISSNAQVRIPEVMGEKDATEKVTTFCLCIPSGVVSKMYDYAMSNYFKVLNPKIREMWGLEKTHEDIIVDPVKL